jgi:hypothetical protein
MEQRLGHTDVRVRRAFPRPASFKGGNLAVERRASSTSVPAKHSVTLAETRRLSYTERSLSTSWLVKPVVVTKTDLEPDVAVVKEQDQKQQQQQQQQQEQQQLLKQQQKQQPKAATDVAAASTEATLKRTQSRADLESKLSAANEALLQLRRRVESLVEGPEKEACIKAVEALHQISSLQPPRSPPKPSRRTSAIIMQAVVTVQQPQKQHLADHYCPRSTTEDSILVH